MGTFTETSGEVMGFKFLDAELGPRLNTMDQPFSTKQLVQGTNVKLVAPWTTLIGQWLHRQGYFYQHTRVGNLWSKPTSNTHP